MAGGSKFSVFDHLLEGCQVIRFDYHYLYVNDAAARQGRKAIHELLGKTMMEAYPGIEDTPLFATIKSCLLGHTAAEFESEFTYADGSTGWFLLKMEPILEGLIILSIDISERKQAELGVKDQLHRLRALREIDLAIINTTDVTFALQRVLENVTESLGVDAADVLLWDPASHRLRFAAGCGFRGRGIEQTEAKLEDGHAGRAAREQRRVRDTRPARQPEPVSAHWPDQR